MGAETDTAAEFVPASRSLAKLRRAADECHGCPLWKDATQTVFGAGPRKAELMLVGEQPGDREDIEGEPFVGPAGGVLARALESAGIDAGGVYLTNAAKHFKWRARGKRRCTFSRLRIEPATLGDPHAARRSTSRPRRLRPPAARPRRSRR